MKHGNRCVLVSTVDSEIEVLEVMNDVLRFTAQCICKSVVHRYTRDEFGTFTCLVKHNPKINIYIHPLLCTQL